MWKAVGNLMTGVMPLALTSAVATQSDEAYRYLPVEPSVVIEFDGPERFVEAFADTRLGVLLADGVFADLRAAGREALVGLLMTRGEGKDVAVGQGVLDWAEILAPSRGRVVLAGQFHETAGFEAVFHFCGDGEVDLAGLLDAWRRQVEAMGHTVGEHKLAGRSVWYVDDEELRTDVMMTDGRSVTMFVSKRPLEFVTEILERDGPGAYLPEAEIRSASAVLHTDMSLLLTLAELSQGLQLAEDSPLNTEGIEILRQLDLRQLTVSVRPRGDSIGLSADVSYGLSPEFLGHLFGAVDLRDSSLLRLVPRDCPAFHAIHVDTEFATRLIEALVAERGVEDGVSRAADAFAQQIGSELIAKLLAALEGTVVWMDAPRAHLGDLDLDDPEKVAREMVDGACVLVKLADADTFEDMLDRAVRLTGLTELRSVTNYREVSVQSFRTSLEVHLAVTEGELVVALGRRGGERMRAVLDGTIDPETRDIWPWEDEFSRRLDSLSPPWHTLQMRDVSVPTGYLWAVHVGVHVALKEVEHDEGLDAVLAILRRGEDLGLAKFVQRFAFDPGRIRFELVW